MATLRLVVGLWVVVGAISCGDARPVSVAVTTGKEEGALALDPAVAEVTIDVSAVDDSITNSVTAKPGEEFDLGEMPDTTIVQFELTGADADGNVIARGRSTSVLIGGWEGTLPLFIQRLGGFARPPGDLVRSHIHAPAGLLGEEFLVATGGERAIGANGDADPALGDFYDIELLSGAESGGDTGSKLPRAARSLVVLGSEMLLIDDAGATFVELSTLEASEATAPDGLAFGDVSGGDAIFTDIDTTFVAGPTRPDVPTKALLHVDGDGNLGAATLANARAGAASAWVPGVGLVVAGGSASGAGIEVADPSDLSVKSIPFPADAITGAAMVLTGEQQIAVLGGRDADGGAAPTRVFDLRCTGAADCVPKVLADVAVPDIAARAHAYAMTDAILVVGENDDGETLAFRVSIADGTVTALPLREPRRGATSVAAQNGTLAIVGGEKLTGGAATSVELYFPE